MGSARSERRLVPDRRAAGDRRQRIVQRKSRATREGPRSPSDIARELTEALLSVDDWLESRRRAGQFNDVRGTQLLRHFAPLGAAVEQFVQTLNAL